MGRGEHPKDAAGRAVSLYRIKRRGLKHPVQEWARERSVKAGTLYPATCQISDKPGGKKGKHVSYDDKKLRELLLLNGNNYAVFKFATRIGGWLFNSVSNKHLIPKLKGLLWWQNNYVPFPLPKSRKAFAERIYCETNIVEVDKITGKYAHLRPGIATLVQIGIGTEVYYPSNVGWKVPAGYIKKDLLEKIK